MCGKYIISACTRLLVHETSPAIVDSGRPFVIRNGQFKKKNHRAAIVD